MSAPAGPPWSRRAPARRLATFFGGACVGLVLGATLAEARAAGDGPYDLVRQLGRVLVLVENDYVDAVDRTRLLEGAIKGMVAELDPHSSYLPPSDYRIFEADTRGEFGGIGVEVDFRNESVVVIAPIEGSPAERGGIRAGDRIVAIDGIAVRDRPIADLVRAMRGKAGTRVVVSIVRGHELAILHVSLTREVIQVSSVASKLLDGNVAYLRIKQFQNGTHDELVRAVGQLTEQARGALAGVVLDLRFNPGGLVDEATFVADELLTGGVIYTTRHRGATVDEVAAVGGGALARPRAAVLVNEYSASASELVAGALQDHGRATVVGAPTFGKGSVQTILPLPGGAGLRLTTMRYYTPSGHAIQARGIHPDLAVPVAAPGGPFGPTRESDLPNHLPAEGEAESPRPAGPELHAPAAADDVTQRLPPIGEVPTDPSAGTDAALAAAYRVVRSPEAR